MKHDDEHEDSGSRHERIDSQCLSHQCLAMEWHSAAKISYHMKYARAAPSICFVVDCVGSFEQAWLMSAPLSTRIESPVGIDKT